jgi:TM2 domain-containing membrane protein YozV
LKGTLVSSETTAATGQKSWIVALLLCIFLGAIGVHRFYVGKIGTAVLMIVTLGGLGIWVLIDLIMIIVGSFTDKQGQKLAR